MKNNCGGKMMDFNFYIRDYELPEATVANFKRVEKGLELISELCSAYHLESRGADTHIWPEISLGRTGSMVHDPFRTINPVYLSPRLFGIEFVNGEIDKREHYPEGPRVGLYTWKPSENPKYRNQEQYLVKADGKSNIESFNSLFEQGLKEIIEKMVYHLSPLQKEDFSKKIQSYPYESFTAMMQEIAKRVAILEGNHSYDEFVGSKGPRFSFHLDAETSNVAWEIYLHIPNNILSPSNRVADNTFHLDTEAPNDLWGYDLDNIIRMLDRYILACNTGMINKFSWSEHLRLFHEENLPTRLSY